MPQLDLMRSPELFNHVGRILHRVWDPIGVRGIDGVEDDEYASYVPGVVRRIERGAGLDQLVDHLIAIETGEMGLRGDRDRAERAAAALLGPLEGSKRA
jgi:hypothetical protein